jgi:hypothetical protein
VGEDKVAPLVAEGLVCNIILLCNSIENELLDMWYVARKLCSKTRKELASMANISTPS